MFWMVVVPELIIAWAVNQWIEGNKIARQFTGTQSVTLSLLNLYNIARGWTPYHGQFLAMGGFLLYKDGQPFQVVSPELFTQLLERSCIEFPFASTEELRERSMAHPLFAAITLLQSIWFIIQCISRRVQGFVITQLELVTLSLVVMNGILLLFWWYKPLDPHTFVRIDLLRPPPPSIPDPPDVDTQAAINFDFSREQTSGRRVKTIFKTEAGFLAENRPNPFLRALQFWFCALLNILQSLFNDYSDLFLRLDKHLISEGSTDVNIFYAPDTIRNLGGFLFTLQNVLGSLFAASHISMWFNHFPTYRDMMVWRIASLTAVALPIVLLLLLIDFYILLTIQPTDFMLQAMEIMAITVVFVGFMTILVARMALIVEAFVCLKSVGGTTLQSPSWSKYIPHFS